MDSEIAALTLLSAANYAIVDYLIKPVKAAYPDKVNGWWWVTYVALGTGAFITWFSGINLFDQLVPTLEPNVGKILTAVIAGAGNNILYSVFGNKGN